MKTRNNFSYLMWGLFAVLLSGLFYFSALEFLNSLNIMGNQYNQIIVVVSGVIIAILVFILDKLLKKGQLTSGDKKYEVYGVIGYIIALLCFLIYRVCSSAATITAIKNSNVVDGLYKRAFIGSEGIIFINGNSVSDFYDTLVSVSFKFLGNNAIGIYIADFAVGLLAFIFTFYAIKAIYGRIEAFTVAIGFAFLPTFAVHARDYSVYMMKYLVFALGLYSVSIAKRLFKTKYGAEIGLVFSTAILGFAFLYENITIGLIFLLLLLIIEDKNLNYIHKVTCVISAVIPFAIAFIIPVAIDGYYDESVMYIRDYIRDVILYRAQGVMNYNHLAEYARSNFILIVIIACIAYVVMFLRCKFDEAHSMIFLFIITLASMCYFVKDDIIAYSLVCTICLLCIAGAGIKKLIGYKNEEDDDKDDLEEPVKKILDEQDPDIEILDEGRQDDEVENDSSEEPVEEPVEEPAEEPAKEPAEEEPVEEPAEEEPEKEEPEKEEPEKEEPEKEEPEEEEPEEEPSEKPDEEPVKEDSIEEPTNVPVEETIETSEKETIDTVPVEIPDDDKINISEVDNCSKDKEKNSEEAAWSLKPNGEKGPELFITPLPIPKRGVKKTVNFDFDVPENMMHFDIDLNDENYFYDVV